MTLINFVSGAIYLKKAPLKEKIQLYALALVFLFILYDSPSGLVCYWILNNTFSLFKNLVNAKVKNPRRLVHLVISGILLIASIFILAKPNYALAKRLAVVGFSMLVALLPVCMRFARRLLNKSDFTEVSTSHHDSGFTIFILSALGLALLAGFLLPSGIIATSPVEFSFVGNTDSPLSYILSSLSFFMGLFLFWPLVIYKMFGGKVQKVLSPLWALIFLLALLNVYVFKYDYGNFSIFFQLDEAKCLKDYSAFFTLLPAVAFLGIIIVFCAIKKFNLKKYAATFLLVLCVAQTGLGIKNTAKIKKEFVKFAEVHKKNSELEATIGEKDKIEPIYHLSRKQQNVVVLFLDKAISSFLPYIVKEFPEMEEQFSGFTYYPNTLSFAGNTVKASPSLMGGYEYTPENENRRPNDFLREKHNEATLVMPKLFLDAGFDVTVTDPPAPNYSWKGDLSAFEKYPEIHVSEVIGKYKSNYLRLHPELENKNLDKCIRANMQSFTLLEIMPPVLRFTFYDFGDFYRAEVPHILSSVADDGFLSNYTTLFFMDKLTDAQNEKGAYLFIDNEATHEFAILKNKIYEPGLNLNPNLAECGEYDFKYLPGVDGTASDLAAYHSNAATLLQVAKWLDKLKELSVYDNTRIIIVADHGAPLSLPPFRNMEYGEDIARYNPLFMFKDFGSSGKLKTDNSFMTNADTLILATKDLPVSEKNPFTNKKYSDFVDKSSIHIHHIVRLTDFDEINPLYLKDTKLWILQDEKYHTPSYTVHDNIFEESNWERIVK